MTTQEINLKDIKTNKITAFTGRPQGEEVRKTLQLDKLDKQKDLQVKVIIPEETTSFNPSFFLGLFYPSIKKLGLENFRKRFQIIIESNDELSREVLNKNLSDGFRNAENSLSQKTGLSLF